MPSYRAMPPTLPAPPFVREEKEKEKEKAQEKGRESEQETFQKPLPPKHATKLTLVQPSQRLSADSKKKLTPSPLSVASFSKMSSPEKDRVTEDGHLQTDAVGFSRLLGFRRITDFGCFLDYR